MSRDSRDKTVGATKEDNLRYLFEVFHPLLLSELRVSHLICYLAPKIKKVKEFAHRIHKLEDDALEKDANELFLKAVKESDEPGRYTAVCEALKDVGCELVVEALMGEEPKDQWHVDHKEMINVFSRNLEEMLKLDVVLPSLKELFYDGDYEVVSSQINAGKTPSAIRLMLLYMHRKKSDWYSIFMKALWEGDHQNLAKDIDPEFCGKHFGENNSAADKTGKFHQVQDSGLPMKEPTRALRIDGKKRASDRTGGENSGVSKIVLNSPKPQVSASHPRKRSSLKDQPGDTQPGEASSLTINLGSSAKMKTSPGKHLDASQPLTSLNTVDDNYPDVDLGSVGFVESSCDCRCCGRILAEVEYLRADVQSIRSELLAVQTLRSEITGMKDLLWQFMTENKK